MLRAAALAILIATPAAAQDRIFNFSGIDSIDARNGVHVEVVPGDEVTVTATARSGDASKLVVRKFGPWLALNRDTRWFIFPYGRQDDILVTITLPELRNIKAFDQSTASATGFAGETLRAEAIQGGTVTVTDTEAETVTLVATEGGSVTMTGTCETVVAEGQYGAMIAAGDLACANAAATARTGATLTLNASTLASTDDTGGGTISLIGAPQIVEYLPGMEPETEEPAQPEG